MLVGKHLVRMRFKDYAGRELGPFDIACRIYGSEHDATLRILAAVGTLPRGLDDDGSGSGRIRQLLVSTGTWLWVQARHGDATGGSLVHVDGSRNVVDATLRLVDRKSDALVRVITTSSDDQPVGDIEARLEQVRLGEPGVSRLEEIEDVASHERSDRRNGAPKLYCATAGTHRLRIDVPRRRRLDLQNVFVPVERMVQLHSGRETVVPIEVQAVGHVRFRFHADGVEAGANIPGLTIDTACAEGQPRGWRGHFVRKLDRGWSNGPAIACTWLGWKMPMPAGRHLLTVKAKDYQEQQLSVVVKPRGVVDVDVWLQP